MVNITHKTNTLRKAIATAIVTVSKQETIDAIEQKQVPKGDVFEMAKTAGLFGVKRTSDMIPDCHPLPVEFTAVNYRIEGLNIHIEVEVHTIYKTGVEVEAMHGASVVALTMYDMLKPIDKQVEVHAIKLKEKAGGKTDFRKGAQKPLKAAVIICSDVIHAGKKEDKGGQLILEQLKSFGIQEISYDIIPDDKTLIEEKLISHSDSGTDLILFTGGTGLSVRDVTPESVRPLLDTEIAGIMEAARNHGLDRTPYAMFSRGVAGLRKKSLVITLPGSTNGVKESMEALFPYVLHVFNIVGGR